MSFIDDNVIKICESVREQYGERIFWKQIGTIFEYELRKLLLVVSIFENEYRRIFIKIITDFLTFFTPHLNLCGHIIDIINLLIHVTNVIYNRYNCKYIQNYLEFYYEDSDNCNYLFDIFKKIKNLFTDYLCPIDFHAGSMGYLGFPSLHKIYCRFYVFDVAPSSNVYHIFNGKITRIHYLNNDLKNMIRNYL